MIKDDAGGPDGVEGTAIFSWSFIVDNVKAIIGNNGGDPDEVEGVPILSWFFVIRNIKAGFIKGLLIFDIIMICAMVRALIDWVLNVVK